MDAKKGTRVNEQIIIEYQNLLKDLPSIIETYEVKKSKLSKYSKLSRSTIIRKLKNQNFTADEALDLVRAINH